MRPIEQGALSGSFVLRHRESLREKFGADALRTALAALSAEASTAIANAGKVGWVPVEAVDELFNVVARQRRLEPAVLHKELSELATEHTVRSVWRVLLRFTSDAQLVAQTPVFYRKAWNRGALTAALERPGFATLTLSSWPDAPEFTVRGLQLSVARVLELAGRDSVRIIHERTEDGAKYQATWK